jgi:hypothetical protein
MSNVLNCTEKSRFLGLILQEISVPQDSKKVDIHGITGEPAAQGTIEQRFDYC